MIDREAIKERVLKYNDSLKTKEFSLFKPIPGWKEVLLKGEALFMSHGGSIKVDFSNIDFTGPEFNNQEWRAQLNRFLWLETCLNEDLKGENDYFVKIARDSVNAFYKFRDGVDIVDKEVLWRQLGDNTLSISVRLGRRYGNGWWGTLPFMREDIITDDFLEKMYESTLIQIEFMIENMTAVGNWRMNQLVSLLFLGYIFDKKEWTGIGVRGLNEAFYSQVFYDGCHEERTLSYHTWMAMEFSSLFYLAQGHPELNLKIDVQKLIKMWEYTIIASCPDGMPAGINDDVRWGVVNTEKFKDRMVKAEAVRKNLIEHFTNYKVTDITMESRFFESAGQWYLKDGNLDNGQFFIFDATKFGGGHCHRAVNSINFFYGNKMLLLDPGTFNYERKDPFCEYGRSTQSHNTLCVDNLSQIRSAAVENVSDISGKCVFVYNTYSGGYTDGEKSSTGVHERLMLWYKGKICIVNDSIMSSGSNFRANFNFLPGNHTFDGKAFATGFEDYNLLMKPIYSNVELEVTKHEGSMDPIAGWLAVDGYKLNGGEKGVSVFVEGPVSHERGSVVTYALIPFMGNEKPDAVTLNAQELIDDELEDIKSRIYNKPVCCSIKSGKSVYEIVTGYLKYRESRLNPSVGKTGKYDSDGKLVFVEFIDGKPVFAYMFDGTYLNYDGIELIRETEYGNYEKTF